MKCPYCAQQYSSCRPYLTHIELRHPGLPAVLFKPTDPIDWSKHSLGGAPSAEQNVPQPDRACGAADVLGLVNDPVAEYDGDIDHSDNEEPAFDGDIVDAENIEVTNTSIPGDRIIGNEAVTVEQSPEAGRPLYDGEECWSGNSPGWNPYRPFSGQKDFTLGGWFYEFGVPNLGIDSYFRRNLHQPGASFQSTHSLHRLVDQMDVEMGPKSWTTASANFWGNTRTWRYRNPVTVVEYLLKQRVYKDDMIYAPKKIFNSTGHRIYSDMHTGDWWWDTQVIIPLCVSLLFYADCLQKALPEGSTIVPLIFFSDETHLTNFSGDKKIWPIYMTIGNLPGRVRAEPSKHALLPVAVLPVPPKYGRVKAGDEKLLQIEKAKILHTALEKVLEPLRAAGREGIDALCPDFKTRRCFPLLATWLADHMEYYKLFHLSPKVCGVCETPDSELGSAALGSYPMRDHVRYEEDFRLVNDPSLSKTTQTAAKRRLEAVKVKPLHNALWNLPHVNTHLLHAPDLLHCVYLGILKHCLEWMKKFLIKHKRLEQFDTVWLSVEPYPTLYAFKRTYSSIGQWHGREMRTFGHVVLICLALALVDPTDSERRPFLGAIRCVRALVDFHLLAHFESHTLQTLDSLVSRLNAFYDGQDVFLEFRASERAKEDANAAVDAHLSASEQGSDVAPPPAKRRRMGRPRQLDEATSQLRIGVLKDKSHFNFPKNHILRHFRDHVERMGSLPFFSTEMGERAHKEQMKVGYQRSNKQNFDAQIVARIARTTAMDIRAQNLRQLAKEGHLSESCVWPARARRDATTNGDQTEQTLKSVKRKAAGYTVGRLTGDLDVGDLSSFILTYLCLKGINVSIDQIINLKVSVFYQVEIVVPRTLAVGRHLIHPVRSTMSDTFHGQERRADWVWILQKEAGANLLNKVGRVRSIFSIQTSPRGGFLRLALVQKAMPRNNGLADADSGIFSVTLVDDYVVYDIGELMARAHLIQDPAKPEVWYQNQWVDVWTYQMVYGAGGMPPDLV